MLPVEDDDSGHWQVYRYLCLVVWLQYANVEHGVGVGFSKVTYAAGAPLDLKGPDVFQGHWDL